MASALASVSAAVVASLFNVTGTILGTVLVSVIATTGAAVYSASMRRAHARIRRASKQRPVLPSTEPRPYPPPRGDKEVPTALAGLANLGNTDQGARSRGVRNSGTGATCVCRRGRHRRRTGDRHRVVDRHRADRTKAHFSSGAGPVRFGTDLLRRR